MSSSVLSRTSLGLAAALAFVTGCSGGGSSRPVQAPATQAPATQAPSNPTIVEAKIVVPAAVKKAGEKKRSYISPAASGLIVTVMQATGTATTTYSITGYDLATNDAASTCSQNASNDTTCTIFFDAPVTSASQSDRFYIYAYDAAQTAGALTPSYVPAGNLLSEDIGSGGAGDAVPSTSATGPNHAIVSGATNDLLFVLQPVVATPKASINDTFATAGTGLVLSVPGSGGQSNLLSVDGYDADNDMIQAHLVANSGDDAYVNPIADSIAPAASFTLSTSPVTSALNDSVSVSYSMTAAAADQPTSAATAVPDGMLTITDSLTSGGFGGRASFPATSQTVTVAPLYAYAPASTPTLAGFTTSVYALQALVPTLSTGYALTPQPKVMTNDCSEYVISAPASGAAGTSQQAVFAVATTAAPAIDTTCELVLSDGLSSTTITFNPDGTHTP